MKYKNFKKLSNYSILINNDLNYVFKVLESSENFLINNKNYIKTIDTYLLAYKNLLDLIPETIENFWSGHIFPYAESEYELESSILLTFLGFYKQAINCLRNVLELGLLSLYFNLEDYGHKEIKNWLYSLENTPFRNRIMVKLLTNKNFEKFNKIINIEDWINTVYGQLCDFTHTKGIRYSSRALLNSNVNTFNKRAFIKWLNLFKETIKIVVALHLLKYPVGLQYTPIEQKFGLNGPAGGFLNPYQVDQIKKIFDDKTLKILQKISNEDESATALAEEINRRPDITEKEFAKQIEEDDKWQIAEIGFKNWLRNQKVILKSLKTNNQNEYKRMLAYIKKMKKWAKLKNLLTK